MMHRWLGLATGLVFALIGLSGALLTLKAPLLRWELGEAAYQVRPSDGPPLDQASWEAAAARAYPQLAHIMGAAAPRGGFLDTPNATVFGKVQDRPDVMGIALIDPSTGEPHGFFVYDDLLFAKVIEFHRRLLAPAMVGGPILALSGGALLISTLSGLWSWWPRDGRWWRRLAPGPITGRRSLFLQVHGVSGGWLALPLLILAATGVWLAAPSLWLTLLGYEVDRRSLSGGWHSLAAEIHANLRLGLVGQTIVFFAGLGLPVFLGTGVWLWWSRPKRR